MSTAFMISEQKQREEREERITRCLRSDDGKALISWINEQLARNQIQLEGASEPIEIGRWQGRVETLKKLLKLKED